MAELRADIDETWFAWSGPATRCSGQQHHRLLPDSGAASRHRVCAADAGRRSGAACPHHVPRSDERLRQEAGRQMRVGLAAAILLLRPGTPALTHRLDEYLQATLISVGKDQLQAEITLTPGVAGLPIVAAIIDTDADGVISEAEQRAYAGQVLRDLSFTIDGHPLTPRLRFDAISRHRRDERGAGRDSDRVQADLPRGGPSRRLVFENRHQSRIGAYLVNCLVPQRPRNPDRGAESELLAVALSTGLRADGRS